MRQYVLPTANIVRQFRQYEPVFCFYEEGVRGVVRDTVLLSSGVPSRVSVEREKGFTLDASGLSIKALHADGLLEKVVRDYEHSVELRYMENTLGQLYASSIIELLVEQIDLEVTRMLCDYFEGLLYEVCKTRWQWLGADLVVRLRFYS